jgi:uncharacterized protein
MPPEVLEEMIRKYIAAQPATLPEINFGWQGGEPTLMGVDFFRRAVALQNQIKPQGQQIANSIQTNGILLDDEWGELLHEHKFLVGLSLDGPRELHDAYRVDRKGAGTFERVMQGLETLKRHQVEFNILTTVHAANGDHPVEVYDFLKENGAAFMQFIPIVEEDGQGGITDRSVRTSICCSARWPVRDRPSACMLKPAGGRWLWNIMATSTPAIIMSVGITGWGISWTPVWQPCSTVRRR